MVYKHRRLSSSRSIRILTLDPSPVFTDPLEVSLTEVALDKISSQVSPYEALSYVWGAPKGDRPLQCDGESLLVTANCESALRNLRLAESTRTLWVDAICIDQDDGKESVRERNAQVAMMGKVYRKATRTICWLGEGTNFTDEVIAHLQRIGSCPSKRGFKKLLQFDGESLLGWESEQLLRILEKLRQTGSLDVGSTCLDHIFSHPWHSRIWTVQEVAHSRDCQMMCGKAILPWDTYAAAAKFLIFEQYIDELDMQAFKSYVSIDVRNILRNYIIGMPNSRTNNSDNESDRKRDFLTSCLTQVRHLQARNPKDKIYGLYAAFSALGVPFQLPDYAKPLVQVYEEATVSMIMHSGTLQVLGYASSNDRNKSLPSWVPDWQDENVKLVTPSFSTSESSCVANAELQVLTPAAGQLHIRGKIVGTVTARSESDFSTLEFPSGVHPGGLSILTEETYDSIKELDALRLLIHRVKLFREWKRLVEKISSPIDEEDPLDIFYGILNFDHESSSHELFDIWLDVLAYPDTTRDISVGERLAEKWRTADVSNASNWSDEIRNCAIIAAYIIQVTELPDLMVDLSGNMGDRAFILIRDYGLNTDVPGTAFHTVRTNDTIVLLEGLDYPIVLRAQKGLWQFIGPAFVMRILDREAWSDEDGVVHESEDFVIV